MDPSVGKLLEQVHRSRALRAITRTQRDIESMAGADLDVVETVGKAAGVIYQDDEELDLVAKIKKRDRKRWELNPSSSEDYTERSQRKR